MKVLLTWGREWSVVRVRKEAGGPGRLDCAGSTQKVVWMEIFHCLAHSLNAVYIRKAWLTFLFRHSANLFSSIWLSVAFHNSRKKIIFQISLLILHAITNDSHSTDFFVSLFFHVIMLLKIQSSYFSVYARYTTHSSSVASDEGPSTKRYLKCTGQKMIFFRHNFWVVFFLLRNYC